MDRFYGMGHKGLALCGMDAAGEMSSWYVFNAIGIYPYSPADEDYIVSVPIFDRSVVKLGDRAFTILKVNSGRKISAITYDNRKVDGYFVSHHELSKGKRLVITTN